MISLTIEHSKQVKTINFEINSLSLRKVQRERDTGDRNAQDRSLYWTKESKETLFPKLKRINEGQSINP